MTLEVRYDQDHSSGIFPICTFQNEYIVQFLYANNFKYGNFDSKAKNTIIIKMSERNAEEEKEVLKWIEAVLGEPLPNEKFEMV